MAVGVIWWSPQDSSNEVNIMTRECLKCGETFKLKRHSQKYCSYEHHSADIIKHKDTVNVHRTWNLPSGTIGAIHELVVSIDLLKRGYHTFRALSPSCKCDLLIMKGTNVFRVEVTTGTIYENGKMHYPPKSKNRDNFDILAVVCGGDIHYFPPLNE